MLSTKWHGQLGCGLEPNTDVDIAKKLLPVELARKDPSHLLRVHVGEPFS